MEKTKDVIDDLKIRAAWGQTGNQDIENYARYSIYESKYGTGNPPTYGTSYDITGSNGGSLLPSGFVRTQIGNDDIKWETTTQTNVGMDFSLFNQPGWLLDGVEYIKEVVSIALEREFFTRKMELLDRARKKTTQKVNLYEKVQIPGFQEAIRKIKRFLEDEENLSKSSQKIVKTRKLMEE